MLILLWFVALALIVVGVTGLFLPALPGPPLVLAGIVVAAWIDGFQKIGWITLGVAVLLTLLATVADLAGSALGARAFGGSRWGAAGAAVGALAGLPFGLLGIAIGPFVGAVVLEMVAARKQRRLALKAGVGSVVGLVLATAAKAGLTMAMLGIAVLAWLF